MIKNAIIIIDVQNAFINEKNKYLSKKIKKHIENTKYDFIIFTKFINSPQSNFIKKLHYDKCISYPETSITKELHDIALKNYIFKKKYILNI